MPSVALTTKPKSSGRMLSHEAMAFFDWSWRARRRRLMISTGSTSMRRRHSVCSSKTQRGSAPKEPWLRKVILSPKSHSALRLGRRGSGGVIECTGQRGQICGPRFHVREVTGEGEFIDQACAAAPDSDRPKVESLRTVPSYCRLHSQPLLPHLELL